MPFLHPPAHRSTATKPRTWNRVDLLLLACGLVAFLVLTFLSGPGFSAGPDRAAAPTAAPALVVPGSPPPGAPAVNAEASGKGTATDAAAPPEAEQPTAQPIALPPAAAPLRITYPAAGFDVEVHPLDPSPAEVQSQTIVPPLTLDGYWVTNFGTPGAGSANTTYIMGHSWEGRDAPFNRLSSSAEPGDTFDVTTATGKIRYLVDAISTEDKSSLKDHEIWQVVPHRIVLISCYTEDLYGKNVVLLASPAPDQGP